jgi:hypothetical protein
MVVGNDVLNQVVIRAPKAKQINVKNMEVVTDVLIVLIGLTVEVAHLVMTVIVQRVSRIYFHTMNVVK